MNFIYFLVPGAQITYYFVCVTKDPYVNAVFVGNRCDCRRQYANSLSVLGVRRPGGTLNVALRILHFSFRAFHSLVFSLEGRAWQEPEPSHMTGDCILDKFLGVVCHCFPPSLDVPTLAAKCLRPQRRERS